jgi:hypothetical protein
MSFFSAESDTQIRVPFETMAKQGIMTIPNQFSLYIDPQLQVQIIQVKQQQAWQFPQIFNTTHES